MSCINKRTRGVVHACQRCRRRKQKCDQRYPQCTNCERADVPCLTYHSGKNTDIPRDYVSDLEKRLAELIQVNETLRRSTGVSQDAIEDVESETLTTQSGPATIISHDGRPSTQDTGSPLNWDLVTNVEKGVDPSSSSQQPRFLGQSSGISFAKMVLAAVNMESLLSPQTLLHQVFKESSAPIQNKTTLPPRHVADHLVEVYFQYRTAHLPILNRHRVTKAINNAYLSLEQGHELDEVADMDMFLAYMVFAIALTGIQHTSGGRSGQSDGCFLSALAWVEDLLAYSKTDLDTLRVVLLLAQFIALSPSRGSLWHLTGFALRLCVDIGLHCETEAQRHDTDPNLLDDRRCLWHSTYYFDRLLCVALGRPSGIPDEDTSVQMPNPWTRSRHDLVLQFNDFDVHNQRAHNHLFALARLESEIRHVQNSRSWVLKTAYPKPNWLAWLQDIKPRLQEWYFTIPEPAKAQESSIFALQAYWEVMFNNTILLLYRPNLKSTHHPMEELIVVFDASCKVVAGLHTLQREGRLEMLWRAVHHLFMAGLGVMYGLWNSKEIRDQTPITKCISTLQSCASTLSAMSATFTGASGCRNAFDTLSSATIDWLVTNNAEEICQSRLEFEKHVKDLMGRLKLPRGRDATMALGGNDNHMSAILSTDNFDLGELLNTAAQWPDLGEFSFDNTGVSQIS